MCLREEEELKAAPPKKADGGKQHPKGRGETTTLLHCTVIKKCFFFFLKKIEKVTFSFHLKKEHGSTTQRRNSSTTQRRGRKAPQPKRRSAVKKHLPREKQQHPTRRGGTATLQNSTLISSDLLQLRYFIRQLINLIEFEFHPTRKNGSTNQRRRKKAAQPQRR